jgi:hypothetical protein
MKPKTKVLSLVKRYFKKHGTAPSIRYILAHTQLNRTQFYQTYPGGIADVCRLAGITEPEARIRQVAKALDAKGNAVNDQRVYPIHRLMWTVNAKTSIEAFDMAIDELTLNRDKLEGLESEKRRFHDLFGDDFFSSHCYAKLRCFYDHMARLGYNGTVVDCLEECIETTTKTFGLSFNP